MADTTIQGIATQTRNVTADDFAEIGGTTNGSRKISPFDEHGQFRNATRPGLYLDGTAIGLAIPNSSTWAIGLDDFSLYLPFGLDDCTPSANKVLLDSVASNLGVRLTLLTTGVLRLQFGNGANLTTYSFDSTANISAYDGLAVHVAVACTRAGNAVFYVNGIALGAAVSISAAAAQTLTSTGTLRMFSDGTNHTAGYIFAPFAPLYNFALSAADVVDIFLRAGAPANALRWGSQVNLIANITRNSDFSAGATDWTNTAASTTLDTGAHNIDVIAFNNFNGMRLAISFLTGGITSSTAGFLGKRFRGRFNVVTSQSAGNQLTLGNSSIGGTVSGTGVQTVEGTWTDDNSYIQVIKNGVQGTNQTQVYDDIALTRLGATCFFTAAAGFGFQMHDESGNGNDASLPTSGMSWLIPAPIGARTVVRKTFNHADISAVSGTTILGILPANCGFVEEHVNVTNPLDAGITLSTGTSGTPAKFISALAVSTAGLKAAASLQLPPQSASTVTTLYIIKSASSTTGDLLPVNAIIERKY